LAIPAEVIGNLSRRRREAPRAPEPVVPIASQCFAEGDIGIGLVDIQMRLGPDLLETVSSIHGPSKQRLADTAWIAEPLAIPVP
jgi:hypothetical protein